MKMLRLLDLERKLILMQRLSSPSQFMTEADTPLARLAREERGKSLVLHLTRPPLSSWQPEFVFSPENPEL